MSTATFGQMNLTQEVYILFNDFALRYQRQSAQENAVKERSSSPACGTVIFCANVLQLLFDVSFFAVSAVVRRLEVSYQPVSILSAAAIAGEILILYNMPVAEVSSAAAAKRQM